MAMKFVLAPDSFKESLSAKEVCEAMERGISRVFDGCEIVHVPMADGGEGTVESLVDATGGTYIERTVQGPLGGFQVQAVFGLLPDEKTAVIEMAQASGLGLVPKHRRNPLYTTTYGTGQLIKEALDLGVEEIVIGIGGSATNDGGCGMAQALGARFLDKFGTDILFGGGALEDLVYIDITDLDPRLASTRIRVATDVDNVLTGKLGASHVFGPQKGATPEIVSILDDNLAHYGSIIKRDLGLDVADIPGAGAAGGLGAGLLAFTGARLERGVDIVIEILDLENHIKDADFVFTGEGGMDFQTKFGKTPYGVARLAKAYGKPVIALAGRLGEDYEDLYDEGMSAIFSVMLGPSSLDEALESASTNIEKTTESISRLIKTTRGVD